MSFLSLSRLMRVLLALARPVGQPPLTVSLAHLAPLLELRPRRPLGRPSTATCPLWTVLRLRLLQVPSLCPPSPRKRRLPIRVRRLSRCHQPIQSQRRQPSITSSLIRRPRPLSPLGWPEIWFDTRSLRSKLTGLTRTSRGARRRHKPALVPNMCISSDPRLGLVDRTRFRDETRRYCPTAPL